MYLFPHSVPYADRYYGELCRIQNVDAAIQAGLVGLHFKNANLLRQDFSLLGISVNENCKQQDLGELPQEHLP